MEIAGGDEILAGLLADSGLPGLPPTPPEPKAAKLRQPGRAFDLIHDGVLPAKLKLSGGKAVYGALISVAMEFMQAQPPLTKDALAEALDSPASRLGVQARLNSRKQPLSKRSYTKLLNRVWSQAAVHIRNSPAFGPGEIESRARALAEAVAAAEWTATRSRADKPVYLHCISEVRRLGTTRPTLPVALIHEATGIPERTCAHSLHRLAREGLLRCAVPGVRTQSGKTGPSGRAAIYVVLGLFPEADQSGTEK